VIKRPLNARFREHVLDGRKTTTIRDKAWPVGVPIMLYNWSGAPYRSKHVDVAAVIVRGFYAIDIHRTMGNVVYYTHQLIHERPIYETEGFSSLAEMDDWFRPLVKPGGMIAKRIMLFRLATDTDKYNAAFIAHVETAGRLDAAYHSGRGIKKAQAAYEAARKAMNEARNIMDERLNKTMDAMLAEREKGGAE
jgi:hypothetical protein